MPEEMSLHDVIYNCRAMRRLDTKEVPEADLVRLIDAANQAPSGSNSQRARWVVVRDAAQKQKLADLNRRHAEPYIKPNLDNPESGKQKRMLDAVVWQMDHMHEIPALIVACFDYGEKVEGMNVYRQAGSVWACWIGAGGGTKLSWLRRGSDALSAMLSWLRRGSPAESLRSSPPSSDASSSSSSGVEA